MTKDDSARAMLDERPRPNRITTSYRTGQLVPADAKRILLVTTYGSCALYEQSVSVTMERVGEGILVTFSTGVTISFETVADAAEFAHSLLMISYLGIDALDAAHEDLGL